MMRRIVYRPAMLVYTGDRMYIGTMTHYLGLTHKPLGRSIFFKVPRQTFNYTGRFILLFSN